jgi:mRNA interferase MazF
MSLLLSRGDVVLTPFPFTDLTQRSLRPALVVSDGPIGDDLVLAGISSVVRGPRVPTDLLIDRSHAEFKQTGLRVASVIRLHKLATVENRILVRRLGQIGPQLQAVVDVSLRKVLAL